MDRENGWTLFSVNRTRGERQPDCPLRRRGPDLRGVLRAGLNENLLSQLNTHKDKEGNLVFFSVLTYGEQAWDHPAGVYMQPSGGMKSCILFTLWQILTMVNGSLNDGCKNN